jgi:triacylglycerol lipase
VGRPGTNGTNRAVRLSSWAVSVPHLILVPGFLGFQRLHTLSYFTDVEALLEQPFAEAGRPVVVRAIRTLPTSSLGARAARLAEVVHALPEGADIHLVGHSTGGLDCRLFLAPGATLPTTIDVEAAASRVRSVVTVAAPHHGAPLASLFTGVHGHRLMSLLSSAITRVLHHSRRSMRSMVEVAKVVWLLDGLTGIEPHVRKPLGEELRAELERRGESDSIERLIDDIGGDTSLLEQLTPSSLALLNTTTRDRPGVRYGSVVAMAPRPRLLRLGKLRLDALSRLTYALYLASHRWAGLSDTQPLPSLSPAQEQVLRSRLGMLPEPRDSDGVVPTRSQVWGTVIDAVLADHFDLMGWYGGRPDRPRLDMLACGAGFGPTGFEAMWRSISRFIRDTAASG